MAVFQVPSPGRPPYMHGGMLTWWAKPRAPFLKLEEPGTSFPPAVECCRGPFLLKQLDGNQARCLLPLYFPF